MNIQTIEMPKKQALKAFREYRDAFRRDHQVRDGVLMRGYKALAKGKQVIDLGQVMKAAGVDEQSRPKLAIVRADARQVQLQAFNEGAARFWVDHRGNDHESRRFIQVPRGTFLWTVNTWDLRPLALVPSIPPRFRPTHALSNYHILWEADWQNAPRDPILLRRLDGMLFAVLAVWELTGLERAVLKG